MAPKKQNKKTNKQRRNPKKPAPATGGQRLKRAFWGLSLLILIVVATGYLVDQFMPPSSKPQQQIQSNGKFIGKIPSKTHPFEIYPKNGLSKPVKRPIAPKVIASRSLPKVAIIIDDIGYDKHIVKKFLALDAPLTFSVLPFSPFEKEISSAARSKNIETMLHLPMEPAEYPMVDPGPGALLTSMSADELINQLKKNLRSVSAIKGVNNHMGSEMTQHSSQMYQIFTILKKEGLYFIDSRTTSKTLCKPSARLLQVPFAERDVFLDHVPTSEFIEGQLNELVRTAHQQGHAIGIGHPHSSTHRTLKKMLPRLKKKIRLVPASELVRQLGSASH